MEIKNNVYYNINFKKAPTKESIELGNKIIKDIRNVEILQEDVKGEPQKYLKWIGKLMRKVAPFVERTSVEKKRISDQAKLAGNKAKGIEPIENLVNMGNIAKELVCMIVYPVQVLTNPDLPKDKRRFVGLYDFFVTCFSLAGTVLYAWKGTKGMNKLCEKLMSKYTKDAAHYPNAKRTVQGGAFVVGIALQTILFKRVLAPALSPPLAAAARKKMDKRDNQKLNKQQGNTETGDKPLPPQYYAVLSKKV